MWIQFNISHNRRQYSSVEVSNLKQGDTDQGFSSCKGECCFGKVSFFLYLASTKIVGTKYGYLQDTQTLKLTSLKKIED